MGICDNLWGLNIYDPVRIPVKRACNGYYLRWYYNGWHYWFFLPGNYSKITEGENYRTIGTRKIMMSSGQVTIAQAKAIRTIMNTREVYLWTVAGWMNVRLEPGSINVKTNMVNSVEIEIIVMIGSKEITYTTGYSPVNDIPVVVPDITYCEVIIGDQVWMCKNFDSNYPGSKVYNDDEANRDAFGGLYTWDQIMSPGFCPDGWHVPTLAEFQTLIAFIGGLPGAGGELKTELFAYWYSPNTAALDTYGFGLRGAGHLSPNYSGAFAFQHLYARSRLWINSAMAYPYTGYARYIEALYNSAAMSYGVILKGVYNSVRLIKDTSGYPLVDKDGNVYTVCTIGNQQWIIENLRTTKYGDGTPIPNLTVNVDWAADASGAYCWFNNDIANKATMGAIYNHWAVRNIHGLEYLERNGVQESGWRVPTLADRIALFAYTGANSGQDLREVGYAHWTLFAPPVPGLDTYGFLALPTQYRNFNGTWSPLPYGETAIWWTNEIIDPAPGGDVRDWYVAYNQAAAAVSVSPPETGLYIRLVRDI